MGTEERSGGRSRATIAAEWLLLLATISMTILFGGAAVHPLSRCWLGDARACRDVPGEHKDWANERACSLGESFACARRGERLLVSDETPQDRERGLALLLDTCEHARSSPGFGESVACDRVSEYLEEDMDYERASQVANTCCSALAASPEEFYFRRCCKSPEKLRQAHAEKLQQASDARRLREQYEKGCKNGGAMDCLILAETLLDSFGRFQRKDSGARARGVALLSELCREAAPKEAFASSSACERLLRLPEQSARKSEIRRLACDRLHQGEPWEQIPWERLCKGAEERR